MPINNTADIVFAGRKSVHLERSGTCKNKVRVLKGKTFAKCENVG